MLTTILCNEALDAMPKNSGVYGAARRTLPDGSVIICHISRVAGRSIIEKHLRTTWHRIAPGEEYSKQISHKKAAELANRKGLE